MKKIKFFLAAMASVALVGCANEEFVGNSPGTTAEEGTAGEAIVFGSGAGKVTRATSNTGSVANMLDHQFKMYGAKKVGSTYTGAFQDYIFWDATTSTASNPDGDWEYVGPATQTYGSDDPLKTIGSAQTIKYWDYSASDYHFVAGSPVANFTFNITSGDIATATVKGLDGHITANPGTPGTTTYYPVYIADPVIVPKTSATGIKFGDVVSFHFTRQQTFVRVGVFETIPGYRISEIHFYEQQVDESTTPATWSWKGSAATTQNIILAAQNKEYFQGLTNGNATLTYNWTGEGAPNYTFTYSSPTTAPNWYGGALVGVPATTSTETTATNLYGTDKDMAVTGYFTVLPTANGITPAPILIKCNYVLTSEDGKGETINVTGATAAIPAAFTKWNPNTSYTYLFKISDNTNGTTGTPGTTDPEGLFPITFNAVVENSTDYVYGYTTIVTTPSITTFQEGSVTDDGIEYKYNSTTPADTKPIYFTAQDDETGELNDLKALNNTTPAVGMVKVYKLADATTEAELIRVRPAAASEFATTIGAAAWTNNGQTVASGKWASFTPDATGYYAIEYITGVTAGVPSYSYKIVKVE